jgi:hypothetical protein
MYSNGKGVSFFQPELFTKLFAKAYPFANAYKRLYPDTNVFYTTQVLRPLYFCFIKLSEDATKTRRHEEPQIIFLVKLSALSALVAK